MINNELNVQKKKSLKIVLILSSILLYSIFIASFVLIDRTTQYSKSKNYITGKL
jgi:hypothetical protein